MWPDCEGLLVLDIDIKLTAGQRTVSRLRAIRLELEIVTRLDAFDLEGHVARYPHSLVGLQVGFGKGNIWRNGFILEYEPHGMGLKRLL